MKQQTEWKRVFWLALVVVTTQAFAADEIHWTITGQNSVTFDWRGAVTENFIDYRDSGVVYPTVTAGPPPSPGPSSSAGPFWEAKLIGLQDNTLYYYSVGGGPEHTFRTPPPRGSSDFTVYAEGDIGSTNAYSGVAGVQNVIAKGLPEGLPYGFPDFVLVLGDLSYGDKNGADDVDQHFNDVMPWSRDAAYMPIWGNHDWHTSSSADQLNNYEGRFDFPNSKTSPGATAAIGNGAGEDWYWFDYANVRFIAYPEKYSGAWSDWNTQVKPVMQAAQDDPNITFIVTFGHQPAYPSGSSTLRGYLNGLAPLYGKYVLNLAGHVHEYARSNPSQTLGVTHLIVGTGGEASKRGALKLHFTNAAIQGDFINTAGTVQDSFMIGAATVDTTPPTVSITNPLADGTVTGTVTVSANAADGSGVAGVQFKLNGSNLGAEDKTVPYSVSWDTTTVGNGAHTLSAEARDVAGNSATHSITVMVNNQISNTVAFAPMADATIKAGSPTTNFGSAATLEADNSPVEQFLMKFVVSGLGMQAVASAKLRLYNDNSSNMGGAFYRVADSSWTEGGVTWNNAPASDANPIASLGAVSSNTWYEVDVTSLITGDGTYSLRVKSTSSDGADYRSKETSGYAPQLVVKQQNP